ncbi:beta-lactamase family protein [Sphingomonas sp. MG17]|uniref:Beta-lactamase family protein n=1 Tax=Sphingomonas tagetis TaxID=2949092 RepID=A0A9X2HNH6_9SPHN|nr:serine hydrolase domain-containing protein [Sphingomonas tagetis]MCP3730578.1 beta-lactamase family protein [Sphingomonas tagetis]
MDKVISRRGLIGGLAAAGAAAVLPRTALARGGQLYPRTHAFMKGFVDRRELAGILAAIGKGQAAPDYFGVGTLALDSATPLGPDTLWRIYSQTKPVTGIAAMLLVEEGKIKLDQPIADFLPAFANMKVLNTPGGSITDVRPARRPITVRQLITHSSGIGMAALEKGPLPDAYDEAGITDGRLSRQPIPGFKMGPPAPGLTVMVDRLATLPLFYEPGSKWLYSVGLAVMGRVIEVVTGQPFDAFLKARIFDPLGMKSTGFRVAAADVPRLSTNYALIDGVLSPIDRAATSVFLDPPAAPYGGGGLVSSARDYDRFLAMLLGEGRIGGAGGVSIMKPETARLAMSNLLEDSVVRKGTLIEGWGAGAGGRVSLPGSMTGEGVFGWGGAAGTTGFIDRKRGYRVGAYTQALPPAALSFQGKFGETFYKDVMA